MFLRKNFSKFLIVNQKFNFIRGCQRSQLENPSRVEKFCHLHKNVIADFLMEDKGLDDSNKYKPRKIQS